MVNDENGDSLPPGWVWTTIGEIADTSRRRRNPQESPDLPFIGLEHVEARTTRLLGTVPSVEMRSAADHFQAGDVLYGRLRPYLNKVTLPDFEGLCSSEFIVFRKRSEIESRFLLYFLFSWDFVSFASRLNTGDRPRVDFDQFANYPFPLPPLAEQQRIVEAIEAQFTRLDAGVAALKRLRASLRRYKAAVLKAAAEGKLVEQDPDDEPASELLQRILKERRAKWEAEQRAKGKDPRKLKYEEPAAPNTDDLPDLPEGWVWASLDSLLEMLQYGTSVKADATETTGVPVLRMGNIQDGQLDLVNLKYIAPEKENIEKYTLADGDLLINRTNSPELVGKTARFSVDRAFVFASYLIRLRINPQASLPDYIAYIINSPLGQNYIAKVRHQVAGQANINSQNIREFPIPFTSLNEQGRITEQIEQFFSIIDELQGTIDATSKRAERLRQAILREAFAGRLVPQDPDDEPANVLLEKIHASRQVKKRNSKP